MSYNNKELRFIYNSGQVTNEVKRDPSIRNYKKQNLDLLTIGEPSSLSYSMASGILGSYDGIKFQEGGHNNSGTSSGQPFMNSDNKMYQHREQFTNPNSSNKLNSIKRGIYGNMPNYIPYQKNELLKGKFFTPLGTGTVPLSYEQQYQKIPDDSMFLFAKNKASPYCHSSFSTSTGQVCSTAEQRRLVSQQRGNNKNHYDDSF